MNNTTLTSPADREAVTDPMSGLSNNGAQDRLQAAIESERRSFLALAAERQKLDGYAVGVGSGPHSQRSAQSRIKPVQVKMPKGLCRKFCGSVRTAS